jgi:hypothetical protein
MAGLGIAHPPGYPLPTLLGHLATLVLPGAPAFATNAAAALGSCLAVLLALVLVARLLDLRRASDRAWLVAAALALALLPQLWFQGQSAKGGLYTLNLCLTLGTILALQEGRQPRFAWLLIGLALANHYMSFILFLPTFLYWSWTQAPRWQAQARRAVWALPGVGLYVYLPVRASASPAMNWGNPSNWNRFVSVLLRKMYGGAESGQDLSNAVHLGKHFIGLWVEQWHWAGLLLLLLGLVPLWRLGLRWQALLLGMALHFTVVLAYNHPPQHAPWVINAFFLPTFVLALIPMLLGAQRLSQALPAQAQRALPWALCAGFLLLAPSRFRDQDYSRDFLLYDYAEDLLLSPVPHSTLLAAGGNDAFPVWCLQQLHSRRQDLTLVDVPLIGDWYLEQLRPRLPELDPSWRTRDQVTQGLLAAPKRPLYYSSHNPGDRGIPLGLVSLVPAQGQHLQLSIQGLWGPWQATRLRWVADRQTPRDANQQELLAYYPDSVAALQAFASRQGVAPLAQGAAQLQERLRRASAP